jgi:hypothetical protein
MDILIKILMVAFTAAVLVCIVIALDRRIARLGDVRWQLLARSLLYAFAFTPTAYHHAPNTIVAPLHLSTIFGNLFYGYDYTAGMFIWGVAAPLLCGWMLIMIVLLFRLKLPEQLSKSPAK